MKKFLVSELIESIAQANNDQIKTSSVLSKLVEFDDYSTIMVDNELAIEGFGDITLTYEAMLDKNADGQLECSGIDPNTENTFIHINFDGVMVFESEEYEPTELASTTGFKRKILDTKLNVMSAKTVNHLLKQILIDYAH